MKQQFIIGLLVCGAIVAAALGLAELLPAVGSVTLAIILGIFVGNLTDFGVRGKTGIAFCEKRLLNIAIALMGFELSVKAAAGLGLQAIPVILGVIVFSIFAGVLAARFLPVPGKLGLLLGIGNGVCGSAAIAASAPLIDADTDDVGISVGVVNLLGAFGIFLLPMLAGILKLKDPQTGLLIGGTIQAVGQTVATGLRMGDHIAGLAIVVKMGRVLLLGVVLIALSLVFRKKNAKGFPVPPFILAFLACALAVNLLPIPESVLSWINLVKKIFLMCAMAGIGMGIKLKTLRTHGAAALLVGSAIFAVNIAYVLLVI